MQLKYSYTNDNLSFIEAIEIGGVNSAIKIIVQTSSRQSPTNWITEELISIIKLEQSSIVLNFSKAINPLHLNIFIDPLENSTDISVKIQHLKPLENNIILNRLKNRTIAFLGCARNIAPNIADSLNILHKLGALFKKYSIYVFENDSNDNSRQLLINYENNNEIKLIYEDDVELKLPQRTDRIAYARNKLREVALKNNYDFYAPVDLDGVITSSDKIESLISPFEFEDVWDACFPVNRDFYYDIWALRASGLLETDYMDLYHRIPSAIKADKALAAVIQPAQSLINKDLRGWIQVQSAFGGLAYYKSEAYLNANYAGNIDGGILCEHVYLNQKLISQNKKLYICPKFEITGLTRNYSH